MSDKLIAHTCSLTEGDQNQTSTTIMATGNPAIALGLAILVVACAKILASLNSS